MKQGGGGRWGAHYVRPSVGWLHNHQGSYFSGCRGFPWKSRKSPEAGLWGIQRCVAKCHHPWEGTQSRSPETPRELTWFNGLSEPQGLGTPVNEHTQEPGKGWWGEKREVSQSAYGARKKNPTAGRCLWLFMHSLCYPLPQDGTWNTQFCKPLGGYPILLPASVSPHWMLIWLGSACAIRCSWFQNHDPLKEAETNSSRTSEGFPRTLGSWLNFQEMLKEGKNYL